MPGILGGHQIDAAQHVQCSLGDVKIADRVGTIYRVGMSLMGARECPDNCVAILARLHYGEFQHWSGNELEPGYKAAKCITTLRHPTRGSPARRLCVGAQSIFGQPGMPSAFSDLTKNAQWYLEQVDPAKPAEAFVWQMMAARSYLALGQAKPAAALYQQLQKRAKSPVQQAQLQLLRAPLLLARATPTRR